MTVFFLCTLMAVLFASSIQYPQNNTYDNVSGTCECGLHNKAKRIVGGSETEVNRYPWVVAIIAVEVSNNKTYYAQVCGGSLISRNWVISACHCFFETGVTASNTLISLGDHDLGSKTEAANIHRDVSKIINHPKYDNLTQNNDIALLKMATPVDFTSNIQPICLPPKTFSPYGKIGIVAGWGTLYENGPSSMILREVSLPVISKRKCKAAYGRSISSKMFCAGYPEGKKDACQGDSGGPFFYKCPSTSRYTQLGVVSYGKGCASPEFPGVYANLMSLLDFIFKHTKGDKLCQPGCKL